MYSNSATRHPCVGQMFEEHRWSRKENVTRHAAALGLLACCSGILFAQSQTSAGDLSCIESLELPTKGLLAARAQTSGVVRATISLGKEQKPDKVDLSGSDNLLTNEVRVAINLSRFSNHCAGRTLVLVFAFNLEEPAVDTVMPPAVRFKPPNRFEIDVRRVNGNIDPAPPRVEKKK